MPKGVEHVTTNQSALPSILRVESLMPKGVEHSTDATAIAGVVAGVESLMPKGVEHTTETLITLQPNQCRISDAERR